jgi:hypothetical protein
MRRLSWVLDLTDYRILLTAVHNSSNKAYLLRTYNHQYPIDMPSFVTPYNAGAEKLRIWQAARATSAAPFFFKSLICDIEDEQRSSTSSGLRLSDFNCFGSSASRRSLRGKREYKDGGIRENNPSIAAWSEFISLYGENQDPALLLSIGTGKPNMDRDGFATVWPGPLGKLSIVKKFGETAAVFKNMRLRYTEGEMSHEDMAKLARGEHTWYKRLNVSDGLQGMRMDNWEQLKVVDETTQKHRIIPGGKTLAVMEEAAKLYLTRPAEGREYTAPKVMLKQVAEKLVRHRRAREQTAAENPERWQYYIGTWLRKPTASEVDSALGSADVAAAVHALATTTMAPEDDLIIERSIAPDLEETAAESEILESSDHEQLVPN